MRNKKLVCAGILAAIIGQNITSVSATQIIDSTVESGYDATDTESDAIKSDEGNSEEIEAAEVETEGTDQVNKYVLDLLNKLGVEATVSTWRSNLQYLQDNYDTIKNIENVDVELIDFYISEYESEVLAEDESENTNEGTIKIQPMAYFYYDRSAAATYANKWYNSFNSAYPNWHNSGGDCANFVSQCLYAGGEKMVGTAGAANATNTSNWFSYGTALDTTKVSSSWRGANAFKNYFISVAKTCKRYESGATAKTTLYNNVNVGDAISFYKIESGNYIAKHTMIVTKRNATDKTVILAGHSGAVNDLILSEKLNSYDGCYAFSMK